jgi:hypothetical protein
MPANICLRKFLARSIMDILSELSDSTVGTQLEGDGSPKIEAMFSWIGQLENFN